jgi:hypothetical protein
MGVSVFLVGGSQVPPIGRLGVRTTNNESIVHQEAQFVFEQRLSHSYSAWQYIVVLA